MASKDGGHDAGIGFIAVQRLKQDVDILLSRVFTDLSDRLEKIASQDVQRQLWERDLRDGSLGSADLVVRCPQVRRQVDARLAVVDASAPGLRVVAGHVPVFSGVMIRPGTQNFVDLEPRGIQQPPELVDIELLRIPRQVDGVIAGPLDGSQDRLRRLEDVMSDSPDGFGDDGVFERHWEAPPSVGFQVYGFPGPAWTHRRRR